MDGTATTPSAAFATAWNSIDEYRDASPEDRPSLLSREPRPTGEPRWDAFLPALGEHLPFHDGVAVPVWTRRPARVLSSGWFLSTLPSARAGVNSSSTSRACGSSRCPQGALALQASVFPDDPVVKPHARALLEDIFGDAPEE